MALFPHKIACISTYIRISKRFSFIRLLNLEATQEFSECYLKPRYLLILLIKARVCLVGINYGIGTNVCKHHKEIIFMYLYFCIGGWLMNNYNQFAMQPNRTHYNLEQPTTGTRTLVGEDIDYSSRYYTSVKLQVDNEQEKTGYSYLETAVSDMKFCIWYLVVVDAIGRDVFQIRCCNGLHFNSVDILFENRFFVLFFFFENDQKNYIKGCVKYLEINWWKAFRFFHTHGENYENHLTVGQKKVYMLEVERPVKMMMLEIVQAELDLESFTYLVPTCIYIWGLNITRMKFI
ncbi:hypothetical protein KUTeg_003003 [Tegillarca granosa]|uniref:Uncharacterized protein n=1 Tax=Tegillarca granosa TaxID=220873 RepID=A0ABQ9FMQ5_TEGGR|nr:hypothetical protein KUTeg_003003 [Tegillarca granosa]